MSGFLDRLAARAVGEAPLVHPRVRARFEPDAGVLPGGGGEEVVEETAEVEEVAAVQRAEVRGPAAAARTFEPERPGLPVERDAMQPVAAQSSPLGPTGADLTPKSPAGPTEVPPTVETPRGASLSPEAPAASRGFLETKDAAAGDAPRGVSTVGLEVEGSRLRRDPHPLAPSPTRTHTRPGEGEMVTPPVQEGNIHVPPTPATALARVVAPPLPGDVSADGRGGRGVRVHEGGPSAELPHAIERSATAPPAPAESRRLAASPEAVIRSRSALAADLPTVEPARGVPLPPSVEESEPSETVVHVSIGRIDVRAAQPPAPERRPARPAGPRLSLADYLKRREERRR